MKFKKCRVLNFQMIFDHNISAKHFDVIYEMPLN